MHLSRRSSSPPFCQSSARPLLLKLLITTRQRKRIADDCQLLAYVGCAVVGLSADEPEILPSSTHPICLMSADSRQVEDRLARPPPGDHFKAIVRDFTNDASGNEANFSISHKLCGRVGAGLKTGHSSVAGSGCPGRSFNKFELGICDLSQGRPPCRIYDGFTRIPPHAILTRFCCQVARPIRSAGPDGKTTLFRSAPGHARFAQARLGPRARLERLDVLLRSFAPSCLRLPAHALVSHRLCG